ncbi:hypothetical protein [Pseudoalteromonas obscura]|uniref:Uncharacterized protein n=1 Tax=Pseudoalteromonas obscura TaxID=3048491 RepID=A0ABT7EP58_9GAMM|nr:hypothetical protein [Pseudoalteromonas sp. P94(2023)]MDK2596824.1 hypothetical protein [Pseudoalteromonas sp. P94(2023)]
MNYKLSFTSKYKALHRLGYTQAWLSLGVITEENLVSQYEEIESSEDKNAEHYRNSGFCDFLSAKNSLTDNEVAGIFELTDHGPDKCDLSENRIIQLIDSNILTDAQLDWITKYPEVSERPIQKRYLRERLTRKIEKSSISDCFEEIKACEDSHIQKYIIGRSDLKSEHINWLSEYGSNKKLRNIAKQLLNSKRFK